jgi:hypothetical protein
MPESHGATWTCSVDAYHAGWPLTHRFHSGILIFVNSRVKGPFVYFPKQQFSKQQATAESSRPFRSELVAMMMINLAGQKTATQAI